MNGLERLILWGTFLAVVAFGIGIGVIYQDVVKPILEIKQKVERIEKLINRMPLPFRDESGMFETEF